jgi:hypothetical protein
VALSGPLTPDHPADAKLKEMCEEAKLPLLVANELVVRGNLPSATRDLRQRLFRS